MPVHGSDQLRAHAEAARTHSAARAHRLAVEADIESSLESVLQAQDGEAAAKGVLQKAYLAYTNPFGVVKTV